MNKKQREHVAREEKWLKDFNQRSEKGWKNVDNILKHRSHTMR